MKKAESISLGLLGILSVFMIQTATMEENLPVLAFFLALLIASGVWLVDLKKKFSLSNGKSNILIVLVLIFHMNTLLHSPMEFIAFSIAKILAWVQVILFFREKFFRIQVHIMSLSFILLCVGAVTQQRLVFAVILILYFLTLVCTVSLILLDQENQYYETHAFIRPAFGLDKKESRQTPFHFVRLALGTIFLTPLLLLFGYRTGDTEKEDLERLDRLRRRSVRRRRRSIDRHFSRKEQPTGDRIFGFWESPEEVAGAEPYNDLIFDTASEGKSRFDLLYRKAFFSGSSRTGIELTFSRELVIYLLKGIVCSLVFAAIVFYLFPRFNRIEIGGFQIGHDNWRVQESLVRSTIGFSETMQLGELGPAYNNYDPVLSIRLAEEKNNIVYRCDGPVYLRGTVLSFYNDQKWSRRTDSDALLLQQRQMDPSLHSIGINFSYISYARQKAVFDPKNDLVCQELEILPSNTNVVFAIWPFFSSGDLFSQAFFDGEWYVRADGERQKRRHRHYTMFTNVFRNGTQLVLTPNQEYLNGADVLLQLNRERFPGLIKLAQQWDAESKLPKDDIIGRSKHLESQLRDTGLFSYTREGLLRNRDLDPLEDFVSLHRAGHCEYFAGALALMLRSIGIPSRIVLGFAYYPETNNSGHTTVRQSDAHSWVEAYIPPESVSKTDALSSLAPSSESIESNWWKFGGWLRLDATPSSDEEFLATVSKSYYSWTEYFQAFWNNYILNYNGYVQSRNVYTPCRELWERFSDRFLNIDFWKNLLPRLWSRAKEFFSTLLSGEWNTRLFLSFIIPFASILAFLTAGIWIIWKIYRFVKKKRNRVTESEKQFLVSVYGKLERHFARFGIFRLPHETSREFVERAILDPGFELLLDEEQKKDPNNVPLDSDGFSRYRARIRSEFTQKAFESVRNWYRFRFDKKTRNNKQK